MTPPSFSQLLTIALTKSLNNGEQNYYFLVEITDALGDLSLLEVKKGKPPKLSKKVNTAAFSVVEICNHWMNYLNLMSYRDDMKRLINTDEINYLLEEEISFNRIKKLSNYDNFIVFYSSYYACNKFDYKNNRFDDEGYIGSEEALNKALYGKNGDPLLNDFINEIKSRLSFNLKYYDRFSKIPQLTKENITTIDKLRVISEIRKLTLLIQNPVLPINDQLLLKLKSLTPTQFEKFSLFLIANIAKTQYDEIDEMITHNGQVGDGGVDGIVKIRYGIGRYTKHFIQCKRYTDTSIGSPELHKFSGAMDGYDAEEGIFITTSYFTRQAKDYVTNLKNKRIDLMDGKQLVDHMLKYTIGIKQTQKAPIIEIDEEFFNQF